MCVLQVQQLWSEYVHTVKLRNVLSEATIMDKAIHDSGLINNDSRLCSSFVITLLFR